MRQSVRPTNSVLALPLLCALIVAGGAIACGGPPEDVPPADSANGRASSASSATLDLTTFDVCTMVPAADVAAIMGATAAQTTGEATMGSFAADCTYTVERGDNVRDYAMVFVYPPTHWDPSSATGAQPIADLGDEAYADKPFSFDQVNVLVQGAFLQTRGNSPAEARKLADLAVARLAARQR
jgi:hypothetical protein